MGTYLLFVKAESVICERSFSFKRYSKIPDIIVVSPKPIIYFHDYPYELIKVTHDIDSGETVIYLYLDVDSLSIMQDKNRILAVFNKLKESFANELVEENVISEEIKGKDSVMV